MIMIMSMSLGYFEDLSFVSEMSTMVTGILHSAKLKESLTIIEPHNLIPLL